MNCAMRIVDMLPLMANYTVTHNGGTVEEFKGPLFMLWAGLHDFLNVIYPTWTKIDYECEMVCRGTIFNVTRETGVVRQKAEGRI